MALIKVFCDFDGTITKKDLGDEVFKVFGRFEPWHTKLVSGEINITQYWHSIFGTLKPGISAEDIREFALGYETDAYFRQFAEFCRTNDIELSIVSDGYDSYIYPVLESIGLAGIKVFCNKMIFRGNETPVPVFPMASESCRCLCASCKRNALLMDTPDDAVIVFIGDGYSDFCAAEHSDIVFAKKNLAAHCNKYRIPHYPFSTFFDVYKIMKDIVAKGKAKQRNQAALNRKRAIEAE